MAFLAWLLVPRAPFGLDGWRWVVLAGSAGAVLVWFVRRARAGKPALAGEPRPQPRKRTPSSTPGKSRRGMEGGELAPTVCRIGRRQRARPVRRERSGGRPIAAAHLMLIVFNLFQAAGYYGFASWVPTLLITQGIAVTTSLGYTFLIAIAAPFGPLLGLLFTDRIERKWIIVGAGLAIAARPGLHPGHARLAVIWSAAWR